MPPPLPSAALVPELSCADLDRSLKFYTEVLGFTLYFARPENGFAYLAREGAELMLEQSNGFWQTAPLHPPLGRGINFQIRVSDAAALAAHLETRGVALFAPLETNWYRMNDQLRGQREFLVQDPDGYLLRFSEWITDQPA